MGGAPGAADRHAVRGRRPTHHTRAARARKDFLKRLGVWIFILFFALSVAGGLIVVGTEIAGKH